MQNNSENYLNFLRERLTEKKYPPTFFEDKSFYDNYAYLFNCYAYAMQFIVPEVVLKEYDEASNKHLYSAHLPLMFTPGFTFQLDPTLTNSGIMCDYFEKDCINLGIDVSKSSITSITKKDAYKVALFIRNRFDEYTCTWTHGFHFYRQNKDGIWSDKFGYMGTPNIANDIMERAKEEEMNLAGVYDISLKLKK